MIFSSELIVGKSAICWVSIDVGTAWPHWAIFESFLATNFITKVAHKYLENCWGFWKVPPFNCCGYKFCNFWGKVGEFYSTIWSHWVSSTPIGQHSNWTVMRKPTFLTTETGRCWNPWYGRSPNDKSQICELWWIALFNVKWWSIPSYKLHILDGPDLQCQLVLVLVTFLWDRHTHKRLQTYRKKLSTKEDQEDYFRILFFVNELHFSSAT